MTDKEIRWNDISLVSVYIRASLTLILSSLSSPIRPIPHTLRRSTATGHWPGPLQKQRSHKNYADVPDVNMTYFEALQRPADLVAVLPHWPIACICTHDLPLTYRNQNQSFQFSNLKVAVILHKRYIFFCSAATQFFSNFFFRHCIILLRWSFVRILLFFFFFICII